MSTQETYLQGIADAIRFRFNKTDTIKAANFANEIRTAQIPKPIDPAWYIATNRPAEYPVYDTGNAAEEIWFTTYGDANYDIDDLTISITVTGNITVDVCNADLTLISSNAYTGTNTISISLAKDSAYKAVHVYGTNITAFSFAKTTYQIKEIWINLPNSAVGNINQRNVVFVTYKSNFNSTSLASAFSYCNSLQAIDTSGWDLSSVTSMTSAFAYCPSLQAIDTSGWNLSSVTSMTYAFYVCTSLQAIDTSGWDLSSVTSMASVFHLCPSLQALDASGWDLSSVTSMTYAFYLCTSLMHFSYFDYNAQASALFAWRNEYPLAHTISFKSLEVSISLANSPNLTHASLVDIITTLKDLTSLPTRTLTIGSANLAKLSAAEIAVATNKNWTVL